MNKLLVFLDEVYEYDSNESIYKSKYTSGIFFKGFDNSRIEYILPIKYSNSEVKEKYSNLIKDNKVYHLPEWTSNMQFLMKYFTSLSFRRKLKAQILKSINNNDIIWVRLPSYFGYLFSKQALKCKKKIIVHIAGSIKSSWKNPKYKGVNRLLAMIAASWMHYLQTLIVKNKDAIVLCTGDHLVMEYKSPNKTEFFIDTNIRKAQQLLHFDSNLKFKLLYIGRLTIDKGIWVLLNAFKELLNSYKFTNIYLSIVGFGPELDKIREFIKNNKLETQIELLGFIPNNEIGNIIKKHDFLVVPSISSYEGFPRVITEAWSFGLGVISVELEGIKSLAINGENILLCKKNDVDSLKNVIYEVVNNSVLRNMIYYNVSKLQTKISYDYFKNIIDNKIGVEL